jgi:hypothetical protein
MALHRLASDFGVYDPDDLAFLKSVYDDILISESLNASQQLVIAGKLLGLFKGGVADRERLYIAALSQIRPVSQVGA